MKLFGLIQLYQRLFGAKPQTQGEEMGAREDAIAKGLAAMQQAQSDALGGAFDDGVASVPPSTGGITQDQETADIAAAVQAAVDPLNKSLSDLQAQYAALQTKESGESATIQGLQGSIAAIQQVLQVLQALPVPAPVPVDPQPASLK